MPNVLSHHYQLNESIDIFRVVVKNFSLFTDSFKNNLVANSGEPDQTPHFAASDLFCTFCRCPTKRTLSLRLWVISHACTDKCILQEELYKMKMQNM